LSHIFEPHCFGEYFAIEERSPSISRIRARSRISNIWTETLTDATLAALPGFGHSRARQERRERGNMPTYEYVCDQCGKKFTLVMSISEHDKKNAKCPHCGSRKITQQISGFNAITKKKS
jgi:putative FmdB family regulatory protein